MDAQAWERKFEAVARLYREATDALDGAAPDLLGIAVRARQVIEHISDYLHVREIGPLPQHDTLDGKLKRLAAKNVLSRREQIHFGTVQIHTNFLIHPGLVPRQPDRRDIEPCLASLGIVVDWFFGECIRRPAPMAVQPPPDETPISATSATIGGTRFGTGIGGELMPVWRTKATASTLRFEAPEGEAEGRMLFKLDPERTTRWFIGQARRKDGTANDFSLPWTSVSRDQGVIALGDGGVTFTNTSGRRNVYIRGELVPDGATRALRHGDAIQLGRSVGAFADGRYYGAVPALAVDPATGLLSRAGLVAEISCCLAAKRPCVLLVVRCPGATAERAACDVALAFHARDAGTPVARIGGDVAVLLAHGADVGAYGAIASGRAAGCVAGYRPLAGAAEQATGQLEACLGALARIAIAGRETESPEDLTGAALVPLPLDAFADRARAAFADGGGATLFALGDLERLERMAPNARAVLERELVEVLGARMGPRDVIAIAGRGLVAWATPGDVERLARDIAVAWHARGPLTSDAVEIDRALSSHLLGAADLADLATRAHELARDGVSALGVGGFPAPIALAARALDDREVPTPRLARLRQIAETAWQLVAFALVAAGRAVRTRDAEPPEPDAWPSPWRAIAVAAARRLVGREGRVMELAQAVRSTAVEQAMLALAGDAEARVERALRELVAGFGALGGWTLVAIESAEPLDFDGTTQRIEYLDFTGPTPRGSRQHVTVVGLRGLGRFVYLVRWAEGLAIALEPFVRRAGDGELVLATAPVTAAGMHVYRAMSSGRDVELEVTAKQVGER